MTSGQLAHLAEQAAFAAGFFSPTNPSAAGRFAECAATARRLSKEIEREEHLGRIRAELSDIAERLNRRTIREPQPNAVSVAPVQGECHTLNV
jgi:hypothetical protein